MANTLELHAWLEHATCQYLRPLLPTELMQLMHSYFPKQEWYGTQNISFYLIETQKTYKEIYLLSCAQGRLQLPTSRIPPRLYAVELLGFQLTNLIILYGKMKRAF